MLSMIEICVVDFRENKHIRVYKSIRKFAKTNSYDFIFRSGNSSLSDSIPLACDFSSDEEPAPATPLSLSSLRKR